MGLLDKLRGELVDIIEWLSDDPHTVVWRFPRYQNEIKNGAQLIVRPGQTALFVHRGQIADVFPEGHYELRTDNLPILSTLAGWKHGFNSPFRSEVYFVSTRQVTNLKWGTPKPIPMRDADFGNVRVRAFGTYTLRVIDPRIVIRELVGADGQFEANELTELLRSIINQAFADLVAEQKIPVMDLASRYTELADQLRTLVCERLDDEYGLEVPLLQIVNVSLPEEVEKALDASASMNALGDIGRYQQYQMAHAIPMAAQNPGMAGGGMGAGVGLGMGMLMANQMGAALQAPAPGAAPGMAPPPPPPPVLWHVTSGGQTTGPYTTEQLVAAIAAGSITATTLVWSAGMAGWTAAAQVPALAASFGAGMPPPPPPPK